MKKEYHKIICAAYLVLVDEDKVLLLRRANTGYEDGNYSVPAGHVEADESVAHALVREAFEEVGITIDPDDVFLKHVMHRRATETNDERLDFFFTCSQWGGDVTNQEPQKCDELRWCVTNALPENVIPYVKKGIEASLKTQALYSERGW